MKKFLFVLFSSAAICTSNIASSAITSNKICKGQVDAIDSQIKSLEKALVEARQKRLEVMANCDKAKSNLKLGKNSNVNKYFQENEKNLHSLKTASGNTHPTVPAFILNGKVKLSDIRSQVLIHRSQELKKQSELAGNKIKTPLFKNEVAVYDLSKIESAAGNTNSTTSKREIDYKQKSSLLSSKEYEEYKEAVSSVKSGKLKQAEAKLLEFIADNKDHRLSENAYYWLGVVYFRNGDFDKATLQFLDNYEKFAGGNKQQDNLLQVAYSLSKLGKKEESCQTLDILSSEHGKEIRAEVKNQQTNLAKKLNCANFANR